jgi:AAA ATPase domain
MRRESRLCHGQRSAAGADSVECLSRAFSARAENRALHPRRMDLELVGRREELGALEDEFTRAAAGEFRFVMLLGDAGVGKSRLGRELIARHGEATCLFARAHALGASAAFGLWTEAADPFLQSVPDSQVVEVCGGLLDDLASLFVRVAVARGSIPERDPPVPRLLQRLARMFGNISSAAPLLVVLDDMHFADPSSWETLRYFARHLDDARTLVVATSRPAELADQDIAAQVLFELGEDGFMSRLEVCPLERPALQELAEALVEQPAPAALVDWLAERSQGNPLYAIGLLRALMAERADLSAPHLQRLPEGLTERVASELRRFDPGPRAMLELLAVVARAMSTS